MQKETARRLSQFGGSKCKVGMKPLLSFSGTQFHDPSSSSADSSPSKFTLAKSMFVDFFRGGDAKEMDVEGLQYMINFAAAEEPIDDGTKRQMVYMRCWRLITKRSGQRLPRVEVEEMGPRIDFRLGRIREADVSMAKESLRKSKGAEVRLSPPRIILAKSTMRILTSYAQLLGPTQEKY